MARLRVFVSSTYYDLRHIRASLEGFIESLGYEPVLHEKGRVAYAPDVALDESCLREVENCDIYVVILGGRYGSEASSSKKSSGGSNPADPYAAYMSVTRSEFERAVSQDIPIYILVEKPVQAELTTYQKNRHNSAIQWAHIDSINIFGFIEEILAMKRNNPVHGFEKFSDIESWLREQWSGLFQELLRRQSTQSRFKALEEQVRDLQSVAETLKAYMEEVVKKVAAESAAGLIQEEEAKEQERRRKRDVAERLMMLIRPLGAPFEAIEQGLAATDSVRDFAAHLGVPVNALHPRLILELSEIRTQAGFGPFKDIKDFTPRISNVKHGKLQRDYRDEAGGKQ
jgi:hypothetical protein